MLILVPLLLVLVGSLDSRHLLPTSTVFDSSQYANISCFRIPSIISTPTALLAFAEARIDKCDDCVKNAIALRRSIDSGATWQSIQFPVPATPSDPADPDSAIGGNPAAVYDSATKTVVLHFCRGQTTTSKGKKTCSPAKSNWQVTSTDDGLTWNKPVDISHFFGKWAGIQPGPGTGIKLQYNKLHPGRLVFAGHFGVYDTVVVWYSDDGGQTYEVSNTTFSDMDEVQPAETNTGDVLVAMRNKLSHDKQAGRCFCKAFANSSDGGASFGGIYYEKELISPVCEAGFSNIAGSLYFSNPANKLIRNDLTIRRSTDNGATWDSSVLVADGPADYSCFVQEPLHDNPSQGGLLWGQCKSPVGFEPVFCSAVKANWVMYFSRFNLTL
jgi:sialidase-1